MTFRAASSIVFLAVCFVNNGAAFIRSLCESGSQCPNEAISIVNKFAEGPLLQSHSELADRFLYVTCDV